MIIVLTSHIDRPKETEIINALFHEGLDLLHIRKPSMNEDEIKSFIEQIDRDFHKKLVLHHHYETGLPYGISHFHFSEQKRRTGMTQTDGKDFAKSTSTHQISDFNGLDANWDYAFFSPVFPSISKKGYGENSTKRMELKLRNNPNVKLIALGGINEDNIQLLHNEPIDGVALLGAVWKSNEPIKTLQKCKKNALIY